jgi:hypothetical protein
VFNLPPQQSGRGGANRGEVKMSKARNGGGIQSRVVKHVNAPKREPIAKAVSPAAVDQQGQAVQFKKEALYQGKGFQPPGPNWNTKQGPGANRTIYKTGSQAMHGKPNPGEINRAPDPPATGTRGHDILSDYGKDYRGK